MKKFKKQLGSRPIFLTDTRPPAVSSLPLSFAIKNPPLRAFENFTKRPQDGRVAIWERGRREIPPAYWPTLARVMEKAAAHTQEREEHLPLPSNALAKDPTLALFAQWAEEDATDDLEELARRERLDEETAEQLWRNRFSLEGRTDFHHLPEEWDDEDAA